MPRALRIAIVAALSALAIGALAGSASAAIWTEVPSNTTEDITAIEYRHIPDPADIERIIVPRIRVRRTVPPILAKEAS